MKWPRCGRSVLISGVAPAEGVDVAKLIVSSHEIAAVIPADNLDDATRKAVAAVHAGARA